MSMRSLRFGLVASVAAAALLSACGPRSASPIWNGFDPMGNDAGNAAAGAAAGGGNQGGGGHGGEGSGGQGGGGGGRR